MTYDGGAIWQTLIISIHIPRVGDDAQMLGLDTTQYQFQSTSPVWGMTTVSATSILSRAISIHIPRVGDDWFVGGAKFRTSHFNPHPPCGG